MASSTKLAMMRARVSRASIINKCRCAINAASGAVNPRSHCNTLASVSNGRPDWPAWYYPAWYCVA
ncbi:hypothetical protein ADK67_27830 [Saccharothrix sp. NRRL B-16348]|nr:hypothetical protein ADK67_27830 [Saccharothrix sp. NRRL B-16348]